jgi:diaminopimelate epimerase
MSQLQFSKYHGAGNDFIMLDRRTLGALPDEATIKALCHRYYGIGADGLIVIELEESGSLRMFYFNSDGTGGMMCANGARCAVDFAHKCGLIDKSCLLICCDMEFKSVIEKKGIISVEFPDISLISKSEDGYVIDTGAPHLICFEYPDSAAACRSRGRGLRYHERYKPYGVNVNFVQFVEQDYWRINTYERGVEDLTLACGTGALAAAIAISHKHERFGMQSYSLESEGGILKISFHRAALNQFEKIVLSGPAIHVFSASIDL